jgi:hypothetical protein
VILDEAHKIKDPGSQRTKARTPVGKFWVIVGGGVLFVVCCLLSVVVVILLHLILLLSFVGGIVLAVKSTFVHFDASIFAITFAC